MKISKLFQSKHKVKSFSCIFGLISILSEIICVFMCLSQKFVIDLYELTVCLCPGNLLVQVYSMPLRAKRRSMCQCTQRTSAPRSTGHFKSETMVGCRPLCPGNAPVLAILLGLMVDVCVRLARHSAQNKGHETRAHC